MPGRGAFWRRGMDARGALSADRRAVTALEYALIAAFTAMLIITGTALFGTNLGMSYGRISDALDGAASGWMPPDTDPGTTSPAGPAAATRCLAGPQTCAGGHLEVRVSDGGP